MQLALVYQNQFPPILVGTTTTPDLVKIVISGTISLNFNYDKFWIRKRVLSQFSKKNEMKHLDEKYQTEMYVYSYSVVLKWNLEAFRVVKTWSSTLISVWLVMFY